MNPTENNETAPTATDPSTAVTLEAHECDECGETCTHERCDECETKYQNTATCRCPGCGDCTDCDSNCLHERPCCCERCDGCGLRLVEHRTFYTEDGVFCKACLEARPAPEEEDEDEEDE
jgi:hypothetical protein